ncbi:MAG: pilus assembly PilX N-terminal domain-containing protein [Gammaproteobacteria bacterium]|nr:pilus assembly PilX N-terminal domain-containing protein [Gammaproteobacteria bacterium]
MKSTIQSIKHRNKQHGAVLVISLLLLVVITTLAISGMNTATTELAMARNDQNYEYAFQAAETGLENAMAQGSFDTLVETDLGQNYINTNDEVVAKVRFEDSTLVPDRAFSLGVGSGVAAYHFLATAEAKSKRAPGSTTDRDSSALHTQAFYVVGPESSSL